MDISKLINGLATGSATAGTAATKGPAAAEFIIVMTTAGFGQAIKGEKKITMLETEGMQDILKSLEAARISIEVGDDGSGLFRAIQRLTNGTATIEAIQAAIPKEVTDYFTSLPRGWLNHYARPTTRGWWLNETEQMKADADPALAFVELATQRPTNTGSAPVRRRTMTVGR